MKLAAIATIQLYQRAVSPYLPSMCRFEPTCSQYAADAVQRYGVVRGSWLGLQRVLRCRPGGSRGYDPVD